MIISHTHKFIFIKSLKTAGTSIETALSNHCSGNDVVIPINDFGHNRDAEGRFIHRSMNADEFYLKIGQHVDAPTIKAREPAETLNLALLAIHGTEQYPIFSGICESA